MTETLAEDKNGAQIEALVDFCLRQAKAQKLEHVHFYFEQLRERAKADLSTPLQTEDDTHAKFVYVMQ